MRLLVTGANGQVGYELPSALASLGHVVALDRKACDVSDAASIRRTIRNAAPDVIINAAAYTAVDKAESEPGAAYAINADALGIIGEEASRRGALVVHYSTDYVFDGALDRPYREDDVPSPRSVYGNSKLAGEVALQQSGAHHLIFRTSWVVSVHGGNFAKTILRLAKDRESLDVVADQWGAPTSAAVIAQVTAIAVARCAQPNGNQLCGLYHLATAGETTWCEYARYVLNRALASGLTLKLKPEAVRAITTSEYPLPAFRPVNSRLNTEKLRNAFAIALPAWQSALDQVLTEIFNHDA